MLRNNNQDAIKRLNRRMLKQNRLRNVVAIIAIVLTTFMFTSVFTIGFSLVKNVNDMMLLGQGSKASIFLIEPTEEQIDTIKGLSKVEAAGLRIKVDTLSDEAGKIAYSLMWMDETEYEKNLSPAIKDIQGKYPEKSDEIMLSTSQLKALGYENYKLGDRVEVYINGEKQTFTLAGTYYGFSHTNPALISHEYVKEQGKDNLSDAYLAISAKSGNIGATIEQLEANVELHSPQKWDSGYDVQSENNSTTAVMIIFMCLISLLIVVSGYLLIYNVMYISVAKDIRFYGMLKTIGTSASQIDRLVKYQSANLALIGIPIGLALGSAVSFALVPISMAMVGSGRSEQLSTAVNFNIWIYVFAVSFAAITVFLSVRKPAKLASKVSPMEALRYYEDNSRMTRKFGSANTERKVSAPGKVRTMACRNVFRDSKRSRLVFASLFFGSIVFLCVNTFIKSLSIDNFINSYFYYDYALYVSSDDRTPSSEIEYETSNSKSFDYVAEKMCDMEGIEYIHVNRYANGVLPFDKELYRPFIEEIVDGVPEAFDGFVETFENGGTDGIPFYSAPVIAVDSKMIEDYNRLNDGKVDVEAFNRGEACLLLSLKSKENAELMRGREITIENEETGRQRNITVSEVSIDRHHDGIVAGYYWILGGAPEAILVSDAFMDELFPDAVANTIVANAKKGMDDELAPEVEKLCNEYDCVGGFDIKSIEAKDFKKSMISLSIVGGGISLILILIGLMNFVNVMVTSVYTRSKEIASLESVGMTKGQLKKMLSFEGVIYGSVSIGLILTLGSIIIYGMGKLTEKIADYAVAEYPVVELIVIAVLIMVICYIVPIVIFKEISKKTVSERIRE